MPRPSAVLADRVQLDGADIIGTNVEDDDASTPNTNAYDRTVQAPLAPATEWRAMFADRAHIRWMPAASYAESDSQRGGVPGQSDANDANDPQGSVITSQEVDGVTRVGTAPYSTLKINMGMADWASTCPQPVPIHGKINLRANPNSPVTKPGLWSNEGTPSNTNYESPAPWAAGIFIG